MTNIRNTDQPGFRLYQYSVARYEKAVSGVDTIPPPTEEQWFDLPIEVRETYHVHAVAIKLFVDLLVERVDESLKTSSLHFETRQFVTNLRDEMTGTVDWKTP